MDKSLVDVFFESINDINELDEAVIEKLWDADVDEDEVVSEGANLDSRDIFKKHKKEYKDHLKAAKAAIKAKDFKTAKKEVKASIEILEKAKKLLDKVEYTDDVGSAILGYFASGLVFLGEHLVLFLIPIVGWYGMIGVGIKVWIEQIQKIVKDIKANKFDMDSLNFYRKRLYVALDAYIKYSKKFLDKIDDMEKAEKGVKESTDVDPEILSIYEAWLENTITEDQMNTLMESIIVNRSLTDIMEETSDDEDSTLRDKYNEVKRLVYERCANGEFSEDTREIILKKAYNRIYNVTESGVTPAVQPMQSQSNTGEDPETKKALDEMNKKIEKETN